MTSDTNVRVVVFPPLEFTISLAADGFYLVSEKHGRGGGEFVHLWEAILFVREECQAHGCRPLMHFDRNLAFIRAAG